MAGPCVEDGDCIHLWYDDPNVRADLVVSPDCDNALACRANGAYVNNKYAYFVVSSANNALNPPVAPGVSTTGFGIHIDLDEYAYFGGPLASPYSVTKVDTVTYKNTSCRNVFAEWDFTMPQTTYRCRGGWDVHLGLSTSVSGCALIPASSSLRLSHGLYTGYSVTKTSYDAADDVPLGIVAAPTMWGGIGIVQPGETLSLARRMYLQVDARGIPVANPQNEIWTLLDPSTRLKVWTLL